MPEFNKMYVLLPVLYFSRTMDDNDPDTVFKLRLTYGIVQTVTIGIILYMYVQALYITQTNSTLIYVPAPTMPFADPSGKKKYTQIAYGTHVLSTVRSLLLSTLFGMAMTLGLHFYRGVIMGMAIQAVMGPFNLLENSIVKAYFVTGTIRSMGTMSPDDRVFDEKLPQDLTEHDEIYDERGNLVPLRQIQQMAMETSTLSSSSSGKRPLEEILLDTWDAVAKADISELMLALNKRNCNYQTRDNQWTALMILSGLRGASGTGEAITRVVKEFHANVDLRDRDGWNALHWAAFHGNADAAHELIRLAPHLVHEKDNEGKTPYDTAQSEENDILAKMIQNANESTTATKKTK